MTEDLTGARPPRRRRVSLLARPLPGVSTACGSRRPICAGTVLEHLATHGEPIRYRHAPERWPLDAYQQIFGHRAGQRGDAERGASVHRPTSSSTSSAAASRSCRSSCTPACRRSKATRCPIPSGTESRTRRRPTLNAVHAARRASDRRRAPPWCGRSSPVDRRARYRPPGRRVGPTSSSPPSVACARSTVSSPAGTSPRPATSSCSRRSRGAGPRARLRRGPTRGLPVARVRRQPSAASGSAIRARDEPPGSRPTLPGGAAGRAVRAAPPGPGDRRGRRPPARHDRQRRPPAPDRARRRRARRSRRAPAPGRASAAGRSSRTASPTAADALFPKAYGELTNELLGYVSEADSSLVDTLFERRRDERVRNATGPARAAAAACGPRSQELARILDEDGYLATCEKHRRGVPHRRAQLRHPRRSRSATGRRARARSTSSAPCCPTRRSSGSATSSTARTTAPTKCGEPPLRSDAGRGTARHGGRSSVVTSGIALGSNPTFLSSRSQSSRGNRPVRWVSCEISTEPSASPEHEHVLGDDPGVARIRVGGPLEIPHSPAVGPILSVVIRAGLERLSSVVGDEQSHTTWTAMHERGLDRSLQVGLGGHVVDRVVHEHRIEGAAEAHFAHVTLEVFALRVDRSGRGEHRR